MLISKKTKIFISGHNGMVGSAIKRALHHKGYNNLLYASRSPIQFTNSNKLSKSWRQVLVYSFPRLEILKFYKIKKKTFLEEKEDSEILRFLEIGSKVKLVKMTNISHPVDTINDLHQVERFLNNEKIKLI